MIHRSSHSSRRRTLATVCCWLVSLALLNQLSLFSVQWWLEPDSTAAAHACQTVDVRVEHGLETGFVGYAQHTQGRLYLYSTIVVRETQCHPLGLSQQQAAEHSITLQYRDVYLNVTHQDVDHEAARLRVLYPPGQSYHAWRYQRVLTLFHFQAQQLDAHGFVLQPLRLDQGGGWFLTLLYWLLKLTACALASAAVFGALHWWTQHIAGAEHDLD